MWGKPSAFNFSYKQKMMVLTSARKMKTANGYDNIYVREDFSVTVQKKRQALVTSQRELRQKGHSVKLRFDKLITEDSLYTCDLFNDRIMRHKRRDKEPAKNPDVPRHEERVRQSGRSWEGRVPETFIVEPPLIHDQQRSQNTDLDHHRTFQTTCCNRPTSLLCVQCGIQVADRQTRTPPTAATPTWRPSKAARVLEMKSSAMPFQQRRDGGRTVTVSRGFEALAGGMEKAHIHRAVLSRCSILSALPTKKTTQLIPRNTAGPVFYGLYLSYPTMWQVLRV